MVSNLRKKNGAAAQAVFVLWCGLMTYPEIPTARSENIRPISYRVCKQPWSKVTSEVNGISSFPSKSGTDSEDEEEQGQWY